MALGPAIIPAQGWFIATIDRDGKLDKEVVLAWAVNLDQDDYGVGPIVFPWRDSTIWSMAYVIIAPNGKIVPVNGQDEGEAFANEEEAAAWIKKEIAAQGCRTGAFTAAERRGPPLKIVEKDESPEEPDEPPENPAS